MPIPSPPAAANSISMGALDMIKSALRLIGVLAAGEQLDAASANDGLMVLNQMIDVWNADRLAIFTIGSTDFPFVLGQQVYTLGTGGDFDMTRPPRIEAMSVILLNNPNNPIEEPLTIYSVSNWQENIPVKNVAANFPQICYDDCGFPLRTLKFWPVPVNQQNNVRIYSWQPLTLASSLQAVINLPPGYSEAFRYNLAVRLSAEFATQLPAAVQAIAVQSLAQLKTMNAPDLGLKSDLLPNPGGYNWSAVEFGNPFS